MKLPPENFGRVLVCAAFCGAWLLQNKWRIIWQEAQQKLAGWREYEIRIEMPDVKVSELLKREVFNLEANGLDQLGFEYLGDYVTTLGIREVQSFSHAPLSAPDAAGSKQFTPVDFVVSRVFVHKGYGCIAFVLASVRRDPQVHLQIASKADGWTYTSEIGELTGADVGRSSHSLKSYHGLVSADQLLKAHLERRAQIAQAGSLSWGAPPAMQEIFAEEEKYAASVREFGRSRSPFSLLIWEYQTKREVHGEWLGDLRGKI
ncbi:hypothetical protein IAD21_01376 [Abditibacteriota bacterium]|nr:hypothetical protein IAD21_01376 [Abditibacteriota bacterium]